MAPDERSTGCSDGKDVSSELQSGHNAGNDVIEWILRNREVCKGKIKG